MTKRQLLITQMRAALGDLTRPELDDTTLVFTIDEVEFEYTEENLHETER